MCGMANRDQWSGLDFVQFDRTGPRRVTLIACSIPTCSSGEGTQEEVGRLPESLDETLRQVLRIFHLNINDDAVIETMFLQIAVELGITISDEVASMYHLGGEQG